VRQYARSDSLTDQNSHGYNFEMVEQMFDPEVRNLILKTPLIQSVHEDKLIWKVEKDGQYLARCAYRLRVNIIVDNSHLHKPEWIERYLEA